MKPSRSDQEKEESCGAHTSSKGVTDILDDHGYDCDQELVKESLISAAQPNRYRGVKTMSVFDKV